MTVCIGCQAEIGPSESAHCPTSRRANGEYLSQRDMAVFALEASPAPLSIYDIQRSIQREFQFTPRRNSLCATLASDACCCWAGRGLYGLWRHGLLPGPRKLADLAQLILLSSQASLNLDELAFTLRRLGYRFQLSSLYRALMTSPIIEREDSERYRVERDSVDAIEFRDGLGLSPDAYQMVVDRTLGNIRNSLQERLNRLASSRGIADDDPIFQDGDIPLSGMY